jgi:hypothetical protein
MMPTYEKQGCGNTHILNSAHLTSRAKAAPEPFTNFTALLSQKPVSHSGLRRFAHDTGIPPNQIIMDSASEVLYNLI